MIKHGCYYCLTVMKPEVVNAFVRLVTLMTPWGISIVPFSSFSVLITPLPADFLGANYCVYASFTSRRPKISSFWWQLCKKRKKNNNQKTDKYPVKRMKLLDERDVNLNSHTRCCNKVQAREVTQLSFGIFPASCDAVSLSANWFVKQRIVASGGRGNSHRQSVSHLTTLWFS